MFPACLCVQVLKTVMTQHLENYQIDFCLSNAIQCMGQNIKSLAACVCVCAREFGVEYLENVEPRCQWTTNSKWHMRNRLVT